MFKSKASLYLLFPLVVIIWGVVIYRVLDVFEDEPEAPSVVRAGEEKELKKISIDTFSLLPIDQDPFLGHYYKKPEKIKAMKTLAKKEVKWPTISYLGLVSGSEKSSGIHVVQINDRQILLEKGNIAEGVKLVSSGNGRIMLLYKGSRKTFSKS
jgi:hypothetical protein